MVGRVGGVDTEIMPCMFSVVYLHEMFEIWSLWAIDIIEQHLHLVSCVLPCSYGSTCDGHAVWRVAKHF